MDDNGMGGSGSNRSRVPMLAAVAGLLLLWSPLAIARMQEPVAATESLDLFANEVEEQSSPRAADDALPDNSTKALQAQRRAEDLLYARFTALPVPKARLDRLTYDMLKESFEADRAVRDCHAELWGVNHISGWHISLPALAVQQPVGTSAARAAALRRWYGFPGFVDIEIANLKEGLKRGYSVPKPVAARVIGQIDAALAGRDDQLPYFSPASRDGDTDFSASFEKLVADRIRPALARYRAYLAAEYLPHARESIGVSALPGGRRCYRALLRRETTLSKSPQAIFAEGGKLIAANRAEIAAIGAKLFGETEISVIMSKADLAADNRFASSADVVDFARAFVASSKQKSEALFLRLPDAKLVVQPLPDYQAGTGLNNYYEPSAKPEDPSFYMINPETWQDDTKGFAEVIAVHEGWPGHHLQNSVARATPFRNKFAQKIVYAAFAEGWARYVERLADEANLYDTPYARIAWRIKPGFGMVVDPGLHWFGWSRPQAAQFLKSSRLFPSDQSVEDMIDRISVMPGQLTAYDAGGNEFMSLRDEARRRLGARFDIRTFHDAILSMGFVPLNTLHRQMTAWIDEQVAQLD